MSCFKPPLINPIKSILKAIDAQQ